jgi:hypothetical protein
MNRKQTSALKQLWRRQCFTNKDWHGYYDGQSRP